MINLLNELLSSINKHYFSSTKTKHGDKKNSGNPD